MKPLNYFKFLKHIASVLLLTSLLSCSISGSNREVADKYLFDELESLDYITNWSFSGWSSIDDLSLIVQTSPNKYYLLVLNTPNPDLRLALQINITSTGRKVESRFDSVSTPRSQGLRSTIAKIYALSGKNQADEIAAQILQADIVDLE